jgi:hypothetical protein
LALALGGQLFRLEAHGTIRAQAHVNDEVRAILRGKRGLLIVTELGDVHEWLPPAAPTKLGSFGGRIGEGAALSDSSRLSAVVDHARLVDFKLNTATRHVRMPESMLLLQGPPAITKNSETRVVSFDGVVLGHDVAGRETLRVSLRASPALSDGGAPLTEIPISSPPVLVDSDAWLAVSASGLDAGVVSPMGELYTAPDTACADPVSLAPAGEGKMLVACRSGSIWLVGD